MAPTPVKAELALRALAVERCALGLTLMVRPNAVSAAVPGQCAAPSGWLARVLGARLFAQGVIEAVEPRREIAFAGAATDAMHAATMYAAAGIWPKYRALAFASAAEATAAAVVGVWVGRELL
jgi:hypothetical protein